MQDVVHMYTVCCLNIKIRIVSHKILLVLYFPYIEALIISELSQFHYVYCLVSCSL